VQCNPERYEEWIHKPLTAAGTVHFMSFRKTTYNNARSEVDIMFAPDQEN
jgi:hypothetical protein